MMLKLGDVTLNHGESCLQFLQEAWSYNLSYHSHGPTFVSQLLSPEEKLFSHWLYCITNAFSLMGFCIWHYYKLACPGYQVFLVKIELSNTSSFWLKKKYVWVCFDNINTELISPSLKKLLNTELGLKLIFAFQSLAGMNWFVELYRINTALKSMK